jgi:molybdate transport system substrate-binding protein
MRSRILKTAALAAAVLLLSTAAFADEVKVITSGAFTAAYLQLAPEFERTTGHKVTTAFGASMGSGPNTIPSRLQRGEPADVVILAGSALDGLIEQGKVVSDSRVDLVRSLMGMAVRAGAPRPDITSIEAFKQTLLHAKSIAISSSASGVYLSTELFQRMGIAEQMKGKTKVSLEAVGPLVASGDAELGFQQISELLPVPGIDYVGPLPAGAQRETVFSAGIVSGARAPGAARALLKFLASAAAAPVIRKSGLEPITAR